MTHYKPSACILILAFAFTSCDFDDVTDFLDELTTCGNGKLDNGEECDDGNTINGDGCSSVCKKETPQPSAPVCGNGEHEAGEECDDGNTINGDGCSSTCTKEIPQTATPVCGNGENEAGEECDDGNTINGDGCSSTCTKEIPQTATPVCGNGKHETGEECDDGNTINDDGCSSACKLESPSSNCPKQGDSCRGDQSLCCDNDVYDCINGQYQIMRCTGNTYCDSVKGFYDCAESCSSKDAEIDFLGYDDYCEGGEFELFACEKGDSGKYGIFGGYYATGYCWDDGTILECDTDGTVGEFECNVCDEGSSSDPYNDICSEY